MDPYAALLHQVKRLDESFQSLLRNHEALKTQNDEILVRLGMEQQSALSPIMTGKQLEDDEQRAGLGDWGFGGAEGNGAERVGLVETTSRR